MARGWARAGRQKILAMMAIINLETYYVLTQCKYVTNGKHLLYKWPTEKSPLVLLLFRSGESFKYVPTKSLHVKKKQTIFTLLKHHFANFNAKFCCHWKKIKAHKHLFIKMNKARLLPPQGVLRKELTPQKVKFMAKCGARIVKSECAKGTKGKEGNTPCFASEWQPYQVL